MAGKEGTLINAPSGRIVHGHPCKQVQRKHQEGPQKGQPLFNADGTAAMQYVFGIAWPYAEFEAHVWPAMAAEVAKGYPNGAPGRFAFKYKRGDQVDDHGKLYSERDGYNGCYVLTVTSNLSDAPPLYAFENGQYRQLTADEIKCGDYIAPQIEFVVNVPAATSTHTPSLYVNPRGLVRTGIGAAIVGRNSFDPTAAFGTGGFALPPGATATPQMPAGAPAMPGAPPVPPQMPGAPPAPMTPPAPVAAPTPVMAPPPPPAPVAPTAPPAMVRPTDPTHISPDGLHWWNGAAWVPAPAAPALPPPAHDFVAAATGAPPMPGAAGGMPGMLPPR